MILLLNLKILFQSYKFLVVVTWTKQWISFFPNAELHFSQERITVFIQSCASEIPFSFVYIKCVFYFGVVVVVVDLGFTTLLTSQVISVAFYSKREKADKFCSEALISAWGSFMCCKSTTGDPWLYFPFEGFLRCEKIHRPRPDLNLRILDSVASMITM